jgi:hypothetical protein
MNFNVEEDNQPQRFWELQILDHHLANNSVLVIITHHMFDLHEFLKIYFANCFSNM